MIIEYRNVKKADLVQPPIHGKDSNSNELSLEKAILIFRMNVAIASYLIIEAKTQ